jgi:hypothetical protein
MHIYTKRELLMWWLGLAQAQREDWATHRWFSEAFEKAPKY